MKRMLGFALFCFAMGMLVMIVIHNRFCGFVLMILCMLAGYYLFCCDDCQPISSFTQAAIVSSLQFAKKYSLKCSPLKAPTTRSRSSSFKIDTRSRWVTFLTSSKIFLLRCSGSTRSFGYPPPPGAQNSFSKIQVRFNSPPHPKFSANGRAIQFPSLTCQKR